jgi:hypothetical protein
VSVLHAAIAKKTSLRHFCLSIYVPFSYLRTSERAVTNITLVGFAEMFGTPNLTEYEKISSLTDHLRAT